MAIRYDNPREIGADRLVNAVAIRERFGGPRVCVDFGTATTFDVVSREGEYLGGSLMTGIEISLEALSERGARLPKIDLAPPSSVIGKNTIDAIRSGVVYGYAGAIDAILRRIFEELGARAAGRRHRRAGAAGRALHRGDRRGRRPAHADRLAPAARAQRLSRLVTHNGSVPDHAALTDPWIARPALQVPNRVLLAPLAGIGNWFVRLQAKRYGAGHGRLRDGLLARHPLPQREDLHEMLRIDPREQPGGPVSIQLFGEDPGVMRAAAARVAAIGADAIDINMGCPVPKVQKTGAGAALLADPDRAVAIARAAVEGAGGLPVTVKLRSGLRPGETSGFQLAPASSRRPAWPRSPSIRAPRRPAHGTPDYELAAPSGQRAAARR